MSQIKYFSVIKIYVLNENSRLIFEQRIEEILYKNQSQLSWFIKNFDIVLFLLGKFFLDKVVALFLIPYVKHERLVFSVLLCQFKGFDAFLLEGWRTVHIRNKKYFSHLIQECSIWLVFVKPLLQFFVVFELAHWYFRLNFEFVNDIVISLSVLYKIWIYPKDQYFPFYFFG